MKLTSSFQLRTYVYVASKPMLNRLHIIIKLLLDFSIEPVLQNYVTTILIVVCSDGSGNNTGIFQGIPQWSIEKHLVNFCSQLYVYTQIYKAVTFVCMFYFLQLQVCMQLQKVSENTVNNKSSAVQNFHGFHRFSIKRESFPY